MRKPRRLLSAVIVSAWISGPAAIAHEPDGGADLPSEANAPAPDASAGTPDAGLPSAPTATMTTVILGRRPISAASSFSVRDRDFSTRPIASVQDILRITPGLVLVQHSGGGKANQYFLRGFDADHGTDVALSIDGVPINIVSHGHGQGFADTNFIIPEVVERVEITKGPYFASQSDFATAGSVNMVSREFFEHTSASLGFGGSPGKGGPSYRGLLIASPKLDIVNSTFAAEVGRSDGPFENPEKWTRYKLYSRLQVHPTSRSNVALTFMGYGSDWHGSGQLPERAVENGLVSRFGSLDPTEGGATGRHQVALSYSLRPDEASELKAMAYLVAYRFNLYSNFTQFLSDDVNGDQIEQTDRRSIFGARLSHRLVRTWRDFRFDTSLGGDVRGDDIVNGLFTTTKRLRLTAVRNNDVSQVLGGAFLNEEIGFRDWLRVNVGSRFDVLSFSVNDRLSSNASGIGGASQFSPKASLTLAPIHGEGTQLELYFNYGHGFHSNDVRGSFAESPISPLTRAIGGEVGARARLFNRWDLAAAVWRLELANETVWVGDEGTTTVNGATHRFGVEFENRFELTPWLNADLDLTLTRARYANDKLTPVSLPLSPVATWSGGLSAKHVLGPGLARAGLRLYGLSDRTASDDGELTAPGFTQFDVHLGFRHRRFDVAVDIENLLNGVFRSAQFATTSRLRNEPAIGAAVPANFACGTQGRLVPSASGASTFGGCEDTAFTPAAPFTARVTATVYLD